MTREAGDHPPEDPVRLRFPLRPEIAHEIADACPQPLERLLKATGAGQPRDGARSRFAVRLSAGAATAFWIALDLPAGSHVGIEDGLYSPRYGVTRPSAVVTATLPAAERTLTLSALWSPEAS